MNMFHSRKKIIFILILVTACLAPFGLSHSPSSINAQTTINILDYMLATSGNNISSGEYFWVDGGAGEFKMCKNHDCSEWQLFRSDGSYIYHVEDVTWATGLNQNVHCDNGHEAFYRVYEGYGHNCSNIPASAGGRWAYTSMHIGQSLSAEYSIVGFDEEVYRSTGDLQCCSAPYAGDLGHNLTLRYHGCVVFSTGAELDDVAILSGGQGEYSENYYYDNEYGWVGFDIGGSSNGAYITDPIDEVEDTTQCVQANASSGSGPGTGAISSGSLSFDWPDDPANFYISRSGNEELIRNLSDLLRISPSPMIPSPPPQQHECVSLTKSVDRRCIEESDPNRQVTYTVNAMNSCPDTISSLVLEDNNAGSIPIPDQLTSGESFEYSYNATISWTTNNEVTLTGQRPDEGAFEITASNTVRVQEDCSYCRYDNVPKYTQCEEQYNCGGNKDCESATTEPSTIFCSDPQDRWCHVASIAMLLAWKNGPQSSVHCPTDSESCGQGPGCFSPYAHSGLVDPRHLWEYSNEVCGTHTPYVLSSCAAPHFSGEQITQTHLGGDPPTRDSYMEDLNAHLCQYGPVTVVGLGSGPSGIHYVVVTGMNESEVFVHNPTYCFPRTMSWASFYQWVNTNAYLTLRHNIWHFTSSP